MSAVLVEAGPDAGAIWHFGEPNQEQKALVAGNGWADLSHRGVISITGIFMLQKTQQLFSMMILVHVKKHL